MEQTETTHETMSEATTRSGVQRIVRNAGQPYYFSHEIVRQYECGEVEFVDNEGNKLRPSYFGAGMSGMNGVLRNS